MIRARRAALVALTGLLVAFVGCASISSRHEITLVERPDFGRYFEGLEGTFVLLDAQAGQSMRYNLPRAGKRLLPASTFKIPNSLILLETGVATRADFPLAWDCAVTPRQPWWHGRRTIRCAPP
ncbi:MAG: hypothetical protein ACREUA_04315 [Burkholderiales bacterium]